jgi:hypothetical protein
MKPLSWLLLASLPLLQEIPASQSAKVPSDQPRSSFTWGDFDGDGFDDAFVVTFAAQGLLFENRGDGTLQDVTAAAGLAGLPDVRFALWEDLDRDRDLDLLVGTQRGSSWLFANENGAFQRVTEIAGAVHPGPALHAEFLDYDRDGLSDLHVRTATEDLLFWNLGSWKFERVELGLDAAGPSLQSFPPASSTRPEVFDGLEQARSTDSPPSTQFGGSSVPGSIVEIPRTEVETIGDVPAGGTSSAISFPACALALEDQDGSGCLRASSTPTLGMLHPLSSDLFVAAGSGNVGIGTTAPAYPLDVVGDMAVRDDELRLFNGGGLETIQLNPSAGGDGFLGISNETGSTSRVLLDGGFNDGGGDITVRAADGSDSLFLDGDSSGAGLLSIRNASGQASIELHGAGVGGAEIALYGSSGNPTVSIDNEDASGGGFLALWNSQGRNTIQLFGEGPALDNAGRIDLYNRDSGVTDNSIMLNALDDLGLGTGSKMHLTTANGSNTPSVFFHGSWGPAGRFAAYEFDGSLAFDFSYDHLALSASNGLGTIAFNRSTGGKSAVVDTPSYGPRLLYCTESPEVWFEDFGAARLASGVASVELDPVFLETATIDDAHPMKVLVTPRGPTRGLWVETHDAHFVVHENSSGTSDVDFDWRVVAKRKGLESRRLDSYVDAREELGSSADPEQRSAAAASKDFIGPSPH